jgi:hypothetical protein
MRTISCYNTKLDPTMTDSAAKVDDEFCAGAGTKPIDQTVKQKKKKINMITYVLKNKHIEKYNINIYVFVYFMILSI